MKSRIITLILLITIIATSCSKGTNEKITSNILFTSLYKTSEGVKEVSSAIKILDGQQVKIKGYMARQSPVDNSFIYLVNMPYMSCPFCVVTDNTMLEVISIYNNDNSPIYFIDKPVEIIGTLEVSEKTDEFNYTTQFRIFADTIKTLVESEEDKIINNYINYLDERNALTMLQTLFIKHDYGLHAAKYNNKTISKEMMGSIISRNCSNPYFSENIEEVEKIIYFLEDYKPTDDHIAICHNRFKELYKMELNLINEIIKTNNKILNNEFENEKISDEYLKLIKLNNDIYKEFVLWNSKLRD